MSLFSKPQHQQTFKKLLANAKIPTAGKNFEECLIALLKSQAEEIESLQKAIKSSKKAKTLGFGLHQKPKS